MSMSTHIVGFRPPDEIWHKMKKVFDACRAAGVPIPREVERFFNDEVPDISGLKIDMTDHPSVMRYKDDMREGFEVDIKSLPPHITRIRFYNSW